MFQSAAVKTRFSVGPGTSDSADETSPSPTFEVVTGTVTFAVGWLASRTVNVAVPPFSFVLFEIADTRNPVVSSSWIVTVAAEGIATVYTGALGVSVTITVSGPSASASSSTGTVMIADDAPR